MEFIAIIIFFILFEKTVGRINRRLKAIEEHLGIRPNYRALLEKQGVSLSEPRWQEVLQCLKDENGDDAMDLIEYEAKLDAHKSRQIAKLLSQESGMHVSTAKNQSITFWSLVFLALAILLVIILCFVLWG